jgi:acetyl esterase/lipase
MEQSRPSLHIPARDIPVPATVSEQARTILAMGALTPLGEFPPLDDLDAWRKVIAAREEVMLAGILNRDEESARSPGAPPRVETQVDEINFAGFPVYVVTPDGVRDDDRRVYLEFHGGGFIHFGGEACRLMARDTAAIVGARVWSVDYRMAPDHPYPAPLDDCVATYRKLLEHHEPGELIVGGASAGGTLTFAAILRARGEGLPLPAAAVGISPAVDLTCSGDTWQTHMGLDPALTGSYERAHLLYANGHDLREPYISPVYGDYSKGFPPTMVTSGTRDVLLSDAVRIHRRLCAAAVPAELHVWEAAGHAMFFRSAPEDADQMQQIRKFVDKHWRGPAQ